MTTIATISTIDRAAPGGRPGANIDLMLILKKSFARTHKHDEGAGVE
jgi:hypothetical protein